MNFWEALGRSIQGEKPEGRAWERFCDRMIDRAIEENERLEERIRQSIEDRVEAEGGAS